jgi:acetolactate synthase I/II/III large subunit
MNQLSGAEALVRMLQLHGVEVIFGLCGDTSLPFYDALYRLDHGMRHVLTRDERSAGYMADVYARVSGKVGVCEGPSGGGATYILPAVVEANESSIAMLAITTDVGVGSRGRYTLTELDQQALFRPVTKWNKVIDNAAALPRTLRSAFRNMTTGRPGAAHLGVPFDVQKDAVDSDEVWADASSGGFPPPVRERVLVQSMPRRNCWRPPGGQFWCAAAGRSSPVRERR